MGEQGDENRRGGEASRPVYVRESESWLPFSARGVVRAVITGAILAIVLYLGGFRGC